MNEVKLYEIMGRQLAEMQALRDKYEEQSVQLMRLQDERDEAIILAGKHFAELERLGERGAKWQ